MANELDRLQANPFRIRAYLRAAEAIAVLPEEAVVVARRGELIRIKGIGSDLARRITGTPRGAPGSDGEPRAPGTTPRARPGFSSGIWDPAP